MGGGHCCWVTPAPLQLQGSLPAGAADGGCTLSPRGLALPLLCLLCPLSMRGLLDQVTTLLSSDADPQVGSLGSLSAGWGTALEHRSLLPAVHRWAALLR